ncbi:MAG: tyrosine-type recombinase/integrase [Dongiaceae bacterium]
MTTNSLFDYRAYWLTRHRRTSIIYMHWYTKEGRRTHRRSTRTKRLDAAKRILVHWVERPVGAGDIWRTLTGQSAMGGQVTSMTLSDNPLILPVLQAYAESLANRPSFVWSQIALRRWTDFCKKEDLVFLHELNLAWQERYVAFRQRRAERCGKKLSNATINHELGMLKSACRYAWQRGRLGIVPYVLSLPNPPPRQRFLTAEEAQRLLHACTERHVYLCVLMGLHTLQRPGAIRELRTSQVDFANNRIDFLVPGTAPTAKGRPVIPITATLRPELEQAVAESRSGHVVEYKGQPVIKLRRSFASTVKRAGLHGVTPYTLRHTGATLLAAHGVPMRQIAGMLGHTTEEVTERYAKHRPEFLKEAADGLDRLFGGLAEGEPSLAWIAANELLEEWPPGRASR